MGLYGPFVGEAALNNLLQKVSALINTYPEKIEDFNPWYRFSPRAEKIMIALDEWNIWDFVDDENYGLLPTYCWRDGLWVASILNMILMTPSVGMANMAQMVNVLAPIIAEREGAWFQTIAYPLRLYRDLMNGERLEVEFDAPIIDGEAAGKFPALSVAAVRTRSNDIHIAIVNRDMKNNQSIRLSNAKIDVTKRKNTMIELTGTSPRATCSLKECCVKENKRVIDAEEIVLAPGSVNVILV